MTCNLGISEPGHGNALSRFFHNRCKGSKPVMSVCHQWSISVKLCEVLQKMICNGLILISPFLHYKGKMRESSKLKPDQGLEISIKL